MSSLWKKTSILPSFAAQDRDINTDVLIIGGGMAGILCAYMLQSAGADYVLAEADTICSGITKNTTAKITCQHGLIYDKLIREFGEEKAKLYFDANMQALGKYQGLCSKIDCNFEKKDSYVYSLDNKHKLDNEIIALQKLGVSCELCHELPLPLPIVGAVKLAGQAQFHPLKFAAHIASGLHICEHTIVRELKGTTAITNNGKIFAKRIIVATHFPFINKHGSYFLKMYQHRSYVIALENAAVPDGIYVDEKDKGMSFRGYNNLLMIGGADHRTGKKGCGWQELRDFASIHYPNAKEKYHWATQDCMTLDKAAYIGAYSSKTEGLYVATGFNKWGMTSSMVAAIILCDMMQGKQNIYAEVFSPSRTIMRPQLCANVFEATINLLTPSTKRCPHLGCALKWNTFERTWDCPCHGSRFTQNGKLIDNPATGDIKL